MALAEPVTLPLRARCARCSRRWVQSAPWPLGSLLVCECGAPAYVDEED